MRAIGFFGSKLSGRKADSTPLGKRKAASRGSGNSEAVTFKAQLNHRGTEARRSDRKRSAVRCLGEGKSIPDYYRLASVIESLQAHSPKLASARPSVQHVSFISKEHLGLGAVVFFITTVVAVIAVVLYSAMRKAVEHDS